MNILVVDDDPVVRRTLVAYVTSAGHQATVVSSSRDALDQVSSRLFDAALVDLYLGEESGLDLLSELLSACSWLRVVLTAGRETCASSAM